MSMPPPRKRRRAAIFSSQLPFPKCRPDQPPHSHLGTSFLPFMQNTNQRAQINYVSIDAAISIARSRIFRSNSPPNPNITHKSTVFLTMYGGIKIKITQTCRAREVGHADGHISVRESARTWKFGGGAEERKAQS